MTYSPLEHLARSIWFPYSENGVFALLSSYFDASGGKDQGFIVVAGYVARLSRWEMFARDWRFMLGQYNVPYFHMKDFAHGKEPFDNPEWKKEPRRENFLRDLVSVIATYTDFSVACLIRYEDFFEVDKHYHLRDAYPLPYVLAARDCIAIVNKQLKKKGISDPVKYVFERGDRGAGALVDLAIAQNLNVPTFEPSRDHGNEKGVVQLQAADFASYELHKGMKATVGNMALAKYRRSLLALASLKTCWGKYDKVKLIELCERARIPPRTPGSKVRVHKKRRPRK